MQQDIRAILPHIASTAQKPNHTLCPTDSWCKYKNDPEAYKHKNGLPDSVVECVKPILEDLADENFLKKCLHGKTQNNNECLNKLIWDRCSKEYYAEKETVEQAVYSAVAYFNDGAVSITKLFEKLGFPGSYTLNGCIARDRARITQSAKQCSDRAKKRRKAIRAIKKGFRDTTEAKEGDMYSDGGH
ncbi:hypothetical protein RRG08_043214 [Elysia crispata]|uniref:Uncharacterized protein n=1 Tax=Elysia crispata TaxID=231223 RepID=A0AAE1DGT9_9GAST|nr:hypothetical protein RRG08_043214 [Elysia crispata]